MILITGPLWSGKHETAMRLLGCGEEEFRTRCVCDAHTLACSCEDLEALADRLSRYDAVTVAEVGGGIVPLEPAERLKRERAGRLACLLGERAEAVVRVFCGIPKVIKGELP